MIEINIDIADIIRDNNVLEIAADRMRDRISDVKLIDSVIISLPKSINGGFLHGELDFLKDTNVFISKRQIYSEDDDIIRVAITYKKINIAIDGPSGSGKSTIAKELSKKLGINYLDTGAMYRAITLEVLNSNIELENENQVKEILDRTVMDYVDNVLYVNGKMVSQDIRSDKVTKHVSLISSYGSVREKLVSLQREIAQRSSSVLDGRDIGTVVLPDAKFKYFLIASPEVRAKRRFIELEGKTQLSYDELLQDIIRRDKFDSTREISPLRKANNAIEIDSSNMSIEEVVNFIIEDIGVDYSV